MTTVLFRTFRLILLTFFGIVFMLVAITALSSCSRTPKGDAIRRHEMNKRTFVRGTTEALRSFDPKPKRPSLPIEVH